MQTIEIRKGLTVGMDEMLQGVSKMDTSALEQFVSKVENLLANRKVKNRSKRERELLTVINWRRLPEAEQTRYDFLFEKLQDETITPKEHEELSALIERAEQHNVEWVEALAELAQLRGIHINDLMLELGIWPKKF